MDTPKTKDPAFVHTPSAYTLAHEGNLSCAFVDTPSAHDLACEGILSFPTPEVLQSTDSRSITLGVAQSINFHKSSDSYSPEYVFTHSLSYGHLLDTPGCCLGSSTTGIIG
jgi:hypothetical protein